MCLFICGCIICFFDLWLQVCLFDLHLQVCRPGQAAAHVTARNPVLPQVDALLHQSDHPLPCLCWLKSGALDTPSDHALSTLCRM